MAGTARLPRLCPLYASFFRIFSAVAASMAWFPPSGVGLERLALSARDDVDVKVEHGLAGRRAIELLNEHAFGAHRVLNFRRELLHHPHESGERLGRNVEQIARFLLGDDESVALGARHYVEEGEVSSSSSILWQGISPRRILAKMLFGS